MLGNMLLSSPTVPENEKISIRVVNMLDKIKDRFRGVVAYLAKSIDSLSVEKASELLEYFTLVDQGIATFMEQHDIPVAED